MPTPATAGRRPAPAAVLLLALLCCILLVQSAVAQGAQSATVLRNANLRAGPGTTYAVTGSAPAGATVEIVGQTPARDWYQLSGGQWIAAFLVRLHTPAAAPAGAIPAGAVAAQVVRITDGDTIRVRLNGAELPVRYILINTPERDEPFGAEATAANRRLHCRRQHAQYRRDSHRSAGRHFADFLMASLFSPTNLNLT